MLTTQPMMVASAHYSRNILKLFLVRATASRGGTSRLFLPNTGRRRQPTALITDYNGEQSEPSGVSPLPMPHAPCPMPASASEQIFPLSTTVAMLLRNSVTLVTNGLFKAYIPIDVLLEMPIGYKAMWNSLLLFPLRNIRAMQREMETHDNYVERFRAIKRWCN